MERGGVVYILTNKNGTVLYVGVTSDLRSRVYQHKNKKSVGFSSRYNVDRLVYYESFNTIEEAISREKQIKSIRRDRKEALINSMNPKWEDLYYQLED